MEVVSHSLFLAEHPVFSKISDFYRRRKTENISSPIVIVCERKEDLIAVRAQIYCELRQQNLITKDQIVDGVSMFTLDNFAAKIIATLANSQPGILTASQIDSFCKPFLSVVQQEQLIKLILIQFGYVDSDALPIAKQLLALHDIAWPADENLFELICNTQNKKNVKTVFDIPEHSLKKILATFQAANQILPKFSRLQDFVSNYLESHFLEHLFTANSNQDDTFIFPYHLLSHQIVWFCAPEYKDANSSYKPGNYQAVVVDAFANAIAKAKQVISPASDDFLYSKTILLPEPSSSSIHIKCRIAKGHVQFLDLAESLIRSSPTREDNFYLLGDYDVGQTRLAAKDAAGSYKVQKSWVDFYFSGQQDFLQDESSSLSYIHNAIDRFYDDFQQNSTILNAHSELFKVLSKDYQLPAFSLNTHEKEIFYQSVQSESVQIGDSHILAQLDRALSYFAHPSKPKNIYIFGRIHGQTTPSFNVKILNDAIFLLKKQGVDIEMIASDKMYRSFWEWLLSQPMQIEFLLPNQTSYEEIPENIRTSKLRDIRYEKFDQQKFLFQTQLAKLTPNLILPDWCNEFNWKTNQQHPVLSASQFEDYMDCPFQFYLKFLLKLDVQIFDSFAPLPLESGTDAHAIAEKFISRLQTIVVLHSKSRTRFLEILTNIVTDESFFYTYTSDELKNYIIKNGIKIEDEYRTAFEALFDEIIELLYNKHKNETDFQHILRIEFLKRVFRRLVAIESYLDKNYPNLVPVFCEYSQTLDIGPAQIVCRIDRIDKDEDGIFHILDYKTSKIASDSQKMTLFPSERKSTQRLSTQGGIYALAFLFQRDNSDTQVPKVASFAEIRLRSLNDDPETSFLRFAFSQPLTATDSLTNELKLQYQVQAQKLLEGDFSQRPLDSTTCHYCDYKKICPTGVKTVFKEEDNQ